MTIPKDNSQLENARRLRREMAYDSARSAFLTALGLEVLRFSNRDVDQDFRSVCAQIDITIQKRLQGPLSHLR